MSLSIRMESLPLNTGMTAKAIEYYLYVSYENTSKYLWLKLSSLLIRCNYKLVHRTCDFINLYSYLNISKKFFIS